MRQLAAFPLPLWISILLRQNILIKGSFKLRTHPPPPPPPKNTLLIIGWKWKDFELINDDNLEKTEKIKRVLRAISQRLACVQTPLLPSGNIAEPFSDFCTGSKEMSYFQVEILEKMISSPSLVPSRPRRFRMWRHPSSLSGKFAEDASCYRTRL